MATELPSEERWDTSGEWKLAKTREAHQWALVAAALLEQQIERLSWSTTRMGPDICHCSQIQDWPRRRSQGQSWRCCRASPEEGNWAQFPTLSLIASHWWVTFLDQGTISKEEQVTGQPSTCFDLGPLPELELDLKHFLQEPATMPEEGKGAIFCKGPP